MSDNDRTHVDLEAVVRRFNQAWDYRGFKTVEQLSHFFQLKIETLMDWLRNEAASHYVASHLGIYSEWLWNGRGIMLAFEQKAWYETWEPTGRLPKDGPTALPHGGKDEPMKLLPAPSKHLLLAPPSKDHFTPEERKKFDALWAPTGEAYALRLMGQIAEGKSPYQKQHRYQRTIVSAARLGWCVNLDHDNGFVDRDYLKEVMPELKWHEDYGMVELMASKPMVRDAYIDEYALCIATCVQVIERIAAELNIDIGELRASTPDLEPKVPLPDWLMAGRKGPRPAP